MPQPASLRTRDNETPASQCGLRDTDNDAPVVFTTAPWWGRERVTEAGRPGAAADAGAGSDNWKVEKTGRGTVTETQEAATRRTEMTGEGGDGSPEKGPSPREAPASVTGGSTETPAPSAPGLPEEGQVRGDRYQEPQPFPLVCLSSEMQTAGHRVCAPGFRLFHTLCPLTAPTSRPRLSDFRVLNACCVRRLLRLLRVEGGKEREGWAVEGWMKMQIITFFLPASDSGGE